MEKEHKARAAQREKEREKTAAKMVDKKMALRMKREKAAKEREAAQRKATAAAVTLAREQSVAALASEKKQRANEDAVARARMQRVLEAEEAEKKRADAEEHIKRMRDAWRAARKPTDPYAEWREGGANAEDSEEEDDDEDDVEIDLTDAACAVEAAEAMTPEEQLQAELRASRTAERDQAASRVLALSSTTLHEALGLGARASDAQIDRAVRKLLRLLHPDYSINLDIKGTKKQQRIEAAFKRLNGLKQEALN